MLKYGFRASSRDDLKYFVKLNLAIIRKKKVFNSYSILQTKITSLLFRVCRWVKIASRRGSPSAHLCLFMHGAPPDGMQADGRSRETIKVSHCEHDSCEFHK
jgi:hypothetical protein